MFTTSFTSPLCVREYCSLLSVNSVDRVRSMDVVKKTPLFCVPSSTHFLRSSCSTLASCTCLASDLVFTNPQYMNAPLS